MYLNIVKFFVGHLENVLPKVQEDSPNFVVDQLTMEYGSAWRFCMTGFEDETDELYDRLEDMADAMGPMIERLNQEAMVSRLKQIRKDCHAHPLERREALIEADEILSRWACFQAASGEPLNLEVLRQAVLLGSEAYLGLDDEDAAWLNSFLDKEVERRHLVRDPVGKYLWRAVKWPLRKNEWLEEVEDFEHYM